jgi:hypothetical protein
VDLPGGAAAQRSTGMACARPAGAELTAAVQPGVEAFEELGVELGGGQITEGRHDVEPDQVVVPLPGGVLELGHLEPLLDGLTDREPCLWVCLLVDLALQPGERDLGLRVAVRSLLEVALLAGQWVDTDVDDRPVAARAQLLDVAASASPTRWQCFRWSSAAPPAGFEPALPPPEAGCPAHLGHPQPI